METDRTLIVVPAYNERENVATLIPQLLNVAPNADVMLIDDNSPDQTADQAEQLFAVHPRFSVLRRKSGRGYGRSLLEGYRTAVDHEYRRLVQLDADFSHDPVIVPQLIEGTLRADVVIGSRYCAGGSVVNWPLRRRLLSRFANQYVRTITGLKVRDCTSGFRCYTRRALQVLLEMSASQTTPRAREGVRGPGSTRSFYSPERQRGLFPTPIEQLRARGPSVVSDKFGHRNCVIAREFAKWPICHSRCNAQTGACLCRGRAKLRNLVFGFESR